MFGSNIVVVQAARLVHAQFDDALGCVAQGNRASDTLLAVPGTLLHRYSDYLELDAQVAQHFGRDTVPFTHQPQEQMLRPDRRVAQALALLGRVLQHASGPLGELVEAVRWLSRAQRRSPLRGVPHAFQG